MRAAYVEIYNEKIRDLLNPTDTDLVVREDKAGRTFVNAQEIPVESFEHCIALLERGQAARQVGETKMNARSSRSHTVFSLQIDSKSGEGIDQSFRASSLNLVDLAGSERLKSTGAEGMRQKEGAHINKSLLVLGTIINRLSSSNGDASKIGHLPYRDSKLTRLLRPALGGNAKTAVLCAVTPSAAHVEETLSTLKFAERAKKVTNNAERNETVDFCAKYREAAVELTLLKQRFGAMEEELAVLKGSPLSTTTDATHSNIDPSTLSTSLRTMSDIGVNPGHDAARAIALSIELQASKGEVKFLKQHVDEVETENDHLQHCLQKKTSEFRGLRSRALQLRSSARKARANERVVRRTLALAYKRLEEARDNLEMSRKKGAHVKVAEGYLTQLSDDLKSWLPSNVMEDVASTESITPPLSESHEIEVDRIRRESNASEMSVMTDGKGSPSARDDTLEGSENVDDQNSLNVQQRSARKPKRKPRPLPEDMVADIDDSEGETDHPMPEDDELNDDDDDDDGDFDTPQYSFPAVGSKIRISDSSRDMSTAKKPKTKAKGWRALRSFYGYGYTQRGVYDKLIGGHKVPSTAAHIST